MIPSLLMLTMIPLVMLTMIPIVMLTSTTKFKNFK